MDADSIAELFSGFGPVSVRRMFSGFGLYADDVCFGMFLRDEIYFKADPGTAPRFEAEGCHPFSYSQKGGKTIRVLSFWQIPSRLYDDPDEMADWARMALGVAQRLKMAKGRKRTKPVGKTASAKPGKTIKPAAGAKPGARKAASAKKGRAKR